MTIFNRLKEEREKLGLSQSSAGELVGVTKQTFIQWEKGKSYPDAEQMSLLLESGFNITYIITGNLPLAPMSYQTGGVATELFTRESDALTRRELALLDDFRSLSDEQKDAAETMLNAVAQSRLKKA
jgi:transcriptional regulator with XRE-family HTH domain